MKGTGEAPPRKAWGVRRYPAGIFSDAAESAFSGLASKASTAGTRVQSGALRGIDKPSEAAKVVENELAAIPRGNTALVGISLAGHTSVDSGALRRRDWNDFMRATRYVLERFERHPSFEGFVIAPFSALDFVRMERD